MATLRIWTALEVEIDGHRTTAGSRTAPIEVTVSNPKLDAINSLAAGDTWTVWGGQTPDPIDDFDVLWIESDVSGVQLELTVDRGNSVGDERICIELQADKPFVLFSDNAYANYTDNFAAGTVDVIDRIRLKNPSGASSSANVRCLLFT